MPKIFATTSGAEANFLFLQAANSYSDVKAQKLFAEFKKNATWQVPTLTFWRAAANLKDPEFIHDERLRYFGGQTRQFLSGLDPQGNEDGRFKDMTAADFVTGMLARWSRNMPKPATALEQTNIQIQMNANFGGWAGATVC